MYINYYYIHTIKYVTNVTNPTISDYNLADNNNMYIYPLSGMLLGLFGRREGAFLDITTGFMSPGQSQVTM